jgi:hypothetical protein
VIVLVFSSQVHAKSTETAEADASVVAVRTVAAATVEPDRFAT